MKNAFNSILLFALIIITYTGYSSTYFVSTTGNNANDGLSPSNAFLTLQFAADLVVAGDSVLVADGTYAGFDFRRYRANVTGTSSDPIVFMTTGNGAIIDQGSQSTSTRNDGINIEGSEGETLNYIEINGFNIIGIGDLGNGIRLVWADNCIVRNCTSDSNQRGIFTGFTNDFLAEYNTCINSTDEHGIYVSNSSDDAIVRYNIIYNNNNIGIHMNGDLSAGEDGINHAPLIYGNRIYDNNQAAGINLDGVLNPVIYNNLIYNNHSAQGIAIFQENGAIMTREAKIYNNTIIVPDDGRWGILIKDGGQVGTEIINNIIITEHNFRGIIAMEATSGFLSNYNIFQDRLSTDGDDFPSSFFAWQANGFDTNSQIVALHPDSVAALFVNYGGADFHLADNSIAIDAGTLTSATTDFDEVSRPQGSNFDIGAFENGIILATDDVSSFSLSKLDNHALLSWKATYSYGIENFIVERSDNGVNWRKVGSVSFKNNLQEYSWMDSKTQEGISYYRVISINQDGITYPSSVLSITFKGKELNTSLYPNPSNGILKIETSRKIHLINIYSMQGQLVKGFKQLSQVTLDDLKSGTYILELKDNTSTTRHKIIKF